MTNTYPRPEFSVTGCDFRVSDDGYSSGDLFFVDAYNREVTINNSPVLTEDRLRTVVDDLLETKQENDLLKRFAKSLMERLYGKN